MAPKQQKTKGSEDYLQQKEPSVYHITIYFPILLYVYQVFAQSKWTDKYTSRCFQVLGAPSSIQLLMTFMVIHICGFEYISHYESAVSSCKDMMQSLTTILPPKQLKTILSAITIGIPTWNIFRLQRRILQEHGLCLCRDGQFNTLYFDWTDMTSFSKKREGAQSGHNKRYKGKPCYKLFLSFLGSVFIDCKLCPGKSNPKVYFKKMVKRAKVMGYRFSAVCGDAAFGNVKNVLFCVKLSLHYALGADGSLGILDKGRKTFKKLNNKGSKKIIQLKKGISAFDFGLQYIGTIGFKAVYTRVIVCRRIHRRRDKKGKLKVRHYYYAVLTDLDWSVTKVLDYYFTRQKIENGIKELKYHYALNRVAHRNLKPNEFYVATKILAMTSVKLFQLNFLPKPLHSLRRKTLIREVFARSLLEVKPLKYPLVPIDVALRRNSKYSWHFKRIIQKLINNHSRPETLKLTG